MGVRVVDDGADVLSGSYYMLYPVGADWDARLAATCRIIAAASRPNKRLHFLVHTAGGVSGTFESEGQNSFNYGRMMGSRTESAANAGLYGTESAEAIRGFILRNIAELSPAEQAMAVPIAGPPSGLAAAFSSCCTQLAYLFSCCSPSYRRLREEDEFDLT